MQLYADVAGLPPACGGAGAGAHTAAVVVLGRAGDAVADRLGASADRQPRERGRRARRRDRGDRAPRVPVVAARHRARHGADARPGGHDVVGRSRARRARSGRSGAVRPRTGRAGSCSTTPRPCHTDAPVGAVFRSVCSIGGSTRVAGRGAALGDAGTRRPAPRRAGDASWATPSDRPARRRRGRLLPGRGDRARAAAAPARRDEGARRRVARVDDGTRGRGHAPRAEGPVPPPRRVGPRVLVRDVAVPPPDLRAHGEGGRCPGGGRGPERPDSSVTLRDAANRDERDGRARNPGAPGGDRHRRRGHRRATRRRWPRWSRATGIDRRSTSERCRRSTPTKPPAR